MLFLVKLNLELLLQEAKETLALYLFLLAAKKKSYFCAVSVWQLGFHCRTYLLRV